MLSSKRNYQNYWISNIQMKNICIHKKLILHPSKNVNHFQYLTKITCWLTVNPNLHICQSWWWWFDLMRLLTYEQPQTAFPEGNIVRKRHYRDFPTHWHGNQSQITDIAIRSATFNGNGWIRVGVRVGDQILLMNYQF